MRFRSTDECVDVAECRQSGSSSCALTIAPLPRDTDTSVIQRDLQPHTYI